MARPERGPAIADALRRQLHERNAPVGSPLPSRLELMREFDASSHTVQKAMDLLVREGVLTTIFGEGTFVAERPPHQCRFGIALDGSVREHGKSILFMRAIELASREVGAAQGIQFTFYREIGDAMNWGEYQRLEDDVKGHRLAGLILAHTLPRLGEHGKYPWHGTMVPCVEIGSTGGDVAAVYGDAPSFVAKAIDHLEGLGRRHVAFLDINAANHYSLETLEREIVERRHFYCPPHWHQRVHLTGIRACLDLLMRPGNDERPDGLVIMDDHATEAATAALAELGVRVPEDLAVVSLGNSALLPPVSVPVTWIGCDTVALLERCLQVLRAQREGKRVPKQSWLEAQEVGDRMVSGVGVQVSGKGRLIKQGGAR